jgi:uncharacterized protein YaaR (DUF327 family)
MATALVHYRFTQVFRSETNPASLHPLESKFEKACESRARLGYEHNKKTGTLEPFKSAVKRCLQQAKGRTKNPTTDEQLARALARADYERGHVAAPVVTR